MNRNGRRQRLKRMDVSPKFMLSLASGKYQVSANELPLDVTVKAAYWNRYLGMFSMTLHSKEWPLVSKETQLQIVPSPMIIRQYRSTKKTKQ